MLESKIDAGMLHSRIKNILTGSNIEGSPVPIIKAYPDASCLDENGHPQHETYQEDQAPALKYLDHRGTQQEDPALRHHAEQAEQQEDHALALAAVRARLQTLEWCLASFSEQLQALQRQQLQQQGQSPDASIVGKVDSLQNLCNDTVAMELRHAQAVSGVSVRMELLEKQVSRLLQDHNSEPSKSTNVNKLYDAPPRTPVMELLAGRAKNNDSQEEPLVSSASLQSLAHDYAAYAVLKQQLAETTPSVPLESPGSESRRAQDHDTLGPSASTSNLHSLSSNSEGYDALKQQLAETALKVFGQVSSIGGQNVLEECIGDEVRRALCDLGRDDVHRFSNTNFLSDVDSEVIDGSTAVDKDDLFRQVEGLLQHVDQVEDTLASGILQRSPVGQPPIENRPPSVGLQRARVGPPTVEGRQPSGSPMRARSKRRLSHPTTPGRNSRTPSPAQANSAIRQSSKTERSKPTPRQHTPLATAARRRNTPPGTPASPTRNHGTLIAQRSKQALGATGEGKVERLIQRWSQSSSNLAITKK